jgi:hypothetical protein
MFDESDRCILMIHGPGQQWHHHACADYLEAMRAHFVYEGQFLARGYQLEGFDHVSPQSRRTASAGLSPLEIPELFHDEGAFATAH